MKKTFLGTAVMLMLTGATLYAGNDKADKNNKSNSKSCTSCSKDCCKDCGSKACCCCK